MKLGQRKYHLSTQIIASLIALVLLTALAVGLPAISLLQNQLEQQAWFQLSQGSRVTQALYATQRSEVATLATLTAQRPTLLELLAASPPPDFVAYLRTLQLGAALDVLLICNEEGHIVAQVGDTLPATICQTNAIEPFFIENQRPTIWLVAYQPIEPQKQHKIVSGIALDYEFVSRMRLQTGLEHSLFWQGRPVATSFSGGLLALNSLNLSPAEMEQTFSLTDRPYYARWLSLGPSGLEAMIALDVTDITATQQQLSRLLSSIIITIAVISSLVGAVLARRISQPLARLGEAATTFSTGNLDRPVNVETPLQEVNLLAETIDQARIQLQRTLAELQQEKQWTEHLLAAIAEGIVTLDQAGRITFFSQGAERITGWSPQQVIGQPSDEIFKLTDPQEMFSQLIPPPGRQRKLTLKLPHGEQVIVAVSGAALRPTNAQEARVALVFRDVSEEEAMHRLLGHFLANISHEFRTPLSALAASVELLLDQAPDLTATELHELLISLHLGIFGLQTLVDNLLESASLETGRFRVSPRPAAVIDMINEASRIIRPLLDKHGQYLLLDRPPEIPPVLADTRRTVQVLVNLLSNANKYGPDDAHITIQVTVDQATVNLAIADQGDGVSTEQRPRLFQRFAYAGDNKTRSGSGLGLSIVKAVVEAQGGQVGMSDRPGGGSIFWFTLPKVTTDENSSGG